MISIYFQSNREALEFDFLIIHKKKYLEPVINFFTNKPLTVDAFYRCQRYTNHVLYCFSEEQVVLNCQKKNMPKVKCNASKNWYHLLAS